MCEYYCCGYAGRGFFRMILRDCHVSAVDAESRNDTHFVIMRRDAYGGTTCLRRS